MAGKHRGTHPGEPKGDAPSNLARYLARPEAQFDLKEEIDKLRQTASWRETGHNAKELVKYPHLRILLVLLRPSKRIPGHKADASISVQTIQGKIRLHLPDEIIERIEVNAAHGDSRRIHGNKRAPQFFLGRVQAHDDD